LTLTPANPPIIIPAGGGTLGFTACIENTVSDPVTFDTWTEVILPNGQTYGPLISRNGLTIPGNATITRNLNQMVPGGAPPGNYTYVGSVRILPGGDIVEDSFPFSKSAGDGFSGGNDNWTVTGWDEEAPLNNPDTYCVLTASPNPFNPETAISFTLPKAGLTTLKVYDLSGREIASLVDGWMGAGSQECVFSAADLPSGVYFSRLTAPGINQTLKLLLVK
jgi:hypothetical protein